VADASGNVYIADTANNTVRRVAANGTITTFAGTGTAGFAGDGSAAASAQLSGPQGLALDSAGNLYIADTLNQRVRKVTGGTITTVAGGNNDLNLPFGVAVDTSGNLYIAEFGANRVRKLAGGTLTTIAGTGVAGYSGDGGAATSAMLNTPQGVAVDPAGNVYIADTGNHRVRVVTGTTIRTAAGNGIAGYDRDGVAAASTPIGNPMGIAVDSSGSLYIADGSARIRKVFPNGLIETIGGSGVAGYTGDGGPAAGAMLNLPASVAVSNNGNVYVADANNNAVRVLQPVAGANGIAVSAIVNGASNQTGAIAPGEVVVIYGSGLGPATLAVSSLGANGLLPTSVAGTTVYFGAVAAPILYTSANQVGAIVPFGVPAASVLVSVVYNGQSTAAVPASVATAVPGIFTLNASGSGQAAAINQDNSVNGAARPVKIGQVISLYLTGAGQTNPPGADGQPGTAPYPLPVLTVTAKVGGRDATVQYAGGAQGLVAGVLQVNVMIPAGVTAGSAVPVVLQVGTNSTQPNITIAVSN
jgi:uncharacterized protein (TIGR03437 family)